MNSGGPDTAPSPWIVRFADLVPAGGPARGTVLDVACGSGRHTRFFADRGHPVLAVDIDVSGLGDLRDRPEVEIVEADLEDGTPPPFAGRRVAAVVVTNYLHRPLLPALVAAVAPGGVLLYETFARGNERSAPGDGTRQRRSRSGPSNPDYLLKPGELRDAVAGHLEVVAFEDTTVTEPRPAAIQHICARRPADPQAAVSGR